MEFLDWLGDCYVLVNCDSRNVINCPRPVSPITMCHYVFMLLRLLLISVLELPYMGITVCRKTSFVAPQKADLQVNVLGRKCSTQ
jgi:hypothetical protein